MGSNDCNIGVSIMNKKKLSDKEIDQGITMARKYLVVVNYQNEFWTGSSWSKEFPDAEFYTLKEVRKLKFSCPVNIVSNYGYNDVQVI